MDIAELNFDASGIFTGVVIGIFTVVLFPFLTSLFTSMWTARRERLDRRRTAVRALSAAAAGTSREIVTAETLREDHNTEQAAIALVLAEVGLGSGPIAKATGRISWSQRYGDTLRMLSTWADGWWLPAVITAIWINVSAVRKYDREQRRARRDQARS